MKEPYICATRVLTEEPPERHLEMHTHDYYEIFVFLSGDANYHVEGIVYPMEPGDILIMKKAEAHSMWINRSVPYERAVIHFTADAIVGERRSLLQDFLDNRPLGQFNRYSAVLFPDSLWHKYIEKIVTHRKNPAYMQLYLTVLLNELYEAQSVVQQNWYQHKNQITDII